MPKAPLHVAVLAGGSGTRFWPAGRRERPKQVLPLDGDDPRPLLLATLERVAPLSTRTPWIVAPKDLARVLGRAAPMHPKGAWLLEPTPRNTAAAVALAALAARASDGPEAPVLIVPADHHALPLPRYRAALRAMATRARKTDAIVTLGLTPTRPATGYGYLRIGPVLERLRTGVVHSVARFVEKPAAPRARRMARDGKHLWNGGTFAFRAGVFLDALAAHLPETSVPLAEAFESFDPAAPDAPRFRRTLTAAYASVPSISVDYGVMERTARVETLAVELDWDDLGNWDAVARHWPEDDAGNRLRGDVTAVDSRGCIVEAGEGHVALLGVEDLIVVRTGDTVLVLPKGRGEDVRAVVDALQQAGREDLLK